MKKFMVSANIPAVVYRNYEVTILNGDYSEENIIKALLDGEEKTDWYEVEEVEGYFGLEYETTDSPEYTINAEL